MKVHARIYNKEIFDDIEVDINGDVKTVKEIKELIQWGKCPVNHVNALFEFLKHALETHG
jgi:tRNA-dihydrouridine synthase